MQFFKKVLERCSSVGFYNPAQGGDAPWKRGTRDYTLMWKEPDSYIKKEESNENNRNSVLKNYMQKFEDMNWTTQTTLISSSYDAE